MEKRKKELPQKYKEVLSLIGYGECDATTVKYIGKYTGLTNESVRAIIRDLIITYGYSIGTSNSIQNPGYYMITNEEERSKTVKNLKNRAAEIMKRALVIESHTEL